MKMKQITAVVQVAVTMEVPAYLTTEVVKDLIKLNTTWDVTVEPNADVVEVSDILEITSITEAEIG